MDIRTLKQKPYVIASALAVALALAFALVLYAFRGAIFLDGNTASGELIDTTTGSPPSLRHPLTGAPIEESVGNPQVYGMMIDHMVDAWPQSGITEAFLVIEAPVEAGIPRFLAFFSSEQNVEKIGPIRSARPYFVDWNDELDGLYVHVGGSNAALDLIGSNGTFDLNQFWNGNAYWRAKNRQAPHNVYTSTTLLASAMDRAREAGKAPERLYGAWLFQDGAAIRPEKGVDVLIDFSSATYRVNWEYDEQTNRYRRLQAGLPHAVEGGKTVEVDNVAVLMTNISVIDQVGRREVRTIGEGQAYVLQNGGLIHGTWKKPSHSERLRFYDADGREVAMVAGQTWIEVVPGADNVVIEE